MNTQAPETRRLAQDRHAVDGGAARSDTQRLATAGYPYPSLWECPAPAPPSVYDDIVTRAVTIRNAPDDARDLDTATAIDRAHDHLGAEARAWALDGAERVNYDTVIVHFTQL